MMEASNELTPPLALDLGASKTQRARYIAESDAVGSIPPPLTLKGMVNTGVARLGGSNLGVLLDKMGERIAFERAGVRLYEALITKYEAVSRMKDGALPAAVEVIVPDYEAIPPPELPDEPAAQTLQRIRAEELEHFRLLSSAMESLGGDPTAQTPCADVIATASMGLMQVVTDPRTTLAQCLNAMLTAELTDNAGWELLIELADQAGETELTGQFLGALAEEQEHLLIVKSWLTALVSERSDTPAV